MRSNPHPTRHSDGRAAPRAPFPLRRSFPRSPSALVLSLAGAVLLALGLTQATSTASPAPAVQSGASQSGTSAQEVRVMPLGDSITGSPGCWRALLWVDLQENGHTDVDFVGTQPPQGCGVDHDGDHEGHGGMLATELAADGRLSDWLAQTEPDVVLMHLGTNDVWNALPTEEILAAYTTLVEQVREANPATRLLVAQILPMAPPECGTCADGVVELNAAIPGWAEELTTAESPITVVDQWTGFDVATDTDDGVHPNDDGFRKMADAWYPPLTDALTAGADG